MALSRTLEPDPGHAGVGTENAHVSAYSLLRFTWISLLQGLEITMPLMKIAACRCPIDPTASRLTADS